MGSHWLIPTMVVCQSQADMLLFDTMGVTCFAFVGSKGEMSVTMLVNLGAHHIDYWTIIWHKQSYDTNSI